MILPVHEMSVLVSDIGILFQVNSVPTKPLLACDQAISQPPLGGFMTTIRAAFYARVSSEQQATAAEYELAKIMERS
jgi:hypothetical protein